MKYHILPRTEPGNPVTIDLLDIIPGMTIKPLEVPERVIPNDWTI